MRSPWKPTNGKGKALWALLALPLLLALTPSRAISEKPAHSDRMNRQIGVMEKILDKLLIDSPNFLVHGSNNTRGLYLPEFGALFSFDASLNLGRVSFSKYLSKLGQSFEIKTDEDGNEIIVMKSPKGLEKDDAGDVWLDMTNKDKEAEELYKQGKEELVQALLDYGETMSELKDGQWIGIAVFMDKLDFFKDDEISRLVLRVKIDDLRAYSADKLKESEVRSRIQVEEY